MTDLFSHMDEAALENCEGGLAPLAGFLIGVLAYYVWLGGPQEAW